VVHAAGRFFVRLSIGEFSGEILAQQGQQDGKGSPVTLCEHADW
jgi:hypothetical protein